MNKYRDLIFTSLLVISFLCLSASCSLNYAQEADDEDSYPELLFNNVKLIRYDDGKKAAEITASAIEKYKTTDTSYAKDVTFKTLNKNGNIDNSGKCKYLSADSKQQEYTLLNDIEIENKEEKLKITAKSLHWNGKSEQLTGGAEDIVTIQRDDLRMEGIGFSANGVDKSFLFKGKIDGIIEN
ncbi:MAG: LPS export ABC transporter periplasmic protein LptC [Treponema sp.]|nr:LPS export ABC transporter periplasmic protein LptC [Treponema sp.]